MRERYRFLLRSAWALTGSRALAKDVVQDCFTSAWKYRAQLHQPELARAWLFRIMQCRALRHFTPGIISIDDDDSAYQSTYGVAAPESGQDNQLGVVRALTSIARIRREVLALFYFDDMPTAQMAEALDIAPATVCSRLAHAGDALKAAMRPTIVAAAVAPSPSNVTAFRKL